MLLTIAVAVNGLSDDLNTQIQRTLLDQQKQIMQVMLRTRSSNARATDLTKCDAELTTNNDECLAIYTSAMASCRMTYDNALDKVDAKY